MNEKAPGYYPLDEEFGYSVEHHAWLLNGQPLSDEEAEPVYKQKMDARRAAESQEEKSTGDPQ